MENVFKIPIDCRKDLNNLETFLDKKNFDYMVSVQIFNVLNVHLALFKKILHHFFNVKSVLS